MTSEYKGPSLKRIEFMVLAALADRPLHGYGIAQRIDDETAGRERVRPGSLYRVLDRLGKRGLLEPADRRRTDADERRTYYRLTALGRVAVVEEARLLSGVADRVVGSGGSAREPA